MTSSGWQRQRRCEYRQTTVQEPWGATHRLVAIGLSPRAAVAVLWTLAVVGGMLGFTIDRFAKDLIAVLGVLFVMTTMIFGVYLAQVRVYEDTDRKSDQGRYG